MKTDKAVWTKAELQIYILLLCANADSKETPEELRLIRSNVDEKSFEKIYNEFSADNEDKSLEKICDSIALHEYSHRELVNLKKEMQKIFFSDKKYLIMERNLDKILDNIIY